MFDDFLQDLEIDGSNERTGVIDQEKSSVTDLVNKLLEILIKCSLDFEY